MARSCLEAGELTFADSPSLHVQAPGYRTCSLRRLQNLSRLILPQAENISARRSVSVHRIIRSENVSQAFFYLKVKSVALQCETSVFEISSLKIWIVEIILLYLQCPF